MSEAHKFTVEFQTHVDRPDHIGMKNIWTKIGSCETLLEAEEQMAELIQVYLYATKSFHRKPNRVFRLRNESRVLSIFNTMTGETKAVLERVN